MTEAGASRFQRWCRTGLVILSVSLYTLLAPFGYLAFALFALVPVRSVERRARLLQSIMRRAFAFMHHWLRWASIVDFDPRSVKPLVPPGSAVVIANHPTLTDTTAILGAVPGLCTAVRADIFRRRWFRPLLAHAGHFDAGGRSPLSTQRLVESALERLHWGFRVLVFPEGTRSPRGGIRPFGRSAFEIACRAGVPVIALLISEKPAWLAPGDRLFGPPAKLPVKRLGILGIYQPEDFSGDSRTMRRYVEAQYVAALLGSRPSHKEPPAPEVERQVSERSEVERRAAPQDQAGDRRCADVGGCRP